MQIWPSVFLFFYRGDYCRLKVTLKVERGVQVLLFGCKMWAWGLPYYQVSQEDVVHFGVSLFTRDWWDACCRSCRRHTCPCSLKCSAWLILRRARISLWQIQTEIKHVVPESSESLLSRVSSMSSSDISISSSRLMPISCSLCKFRISCKTHSKKGIRPTKTGECDFSGARGRKSSLSTLTTGSEGYLEIKVEKRNADVGRSKRCSHSWRSLYLIIDHHTTDIW